MVGDGGKPMLTVIDGGKAKDPAPRDAYPLVHAFECLLVTALCYLPGLYGRVGVHLDEERMPQAPARLALRAAKAIYHDTGRGPSSVQYVLQRLATWAAAGKVKKHEIDAVDTMFCDAEHDGPPDEDQIAAAVIPMLRKSMQRLAIETATREYVKPDGEPERALEALEVARSIGQGDATLGTIIGPRTPGRLRTFMVGARLPTCILELDDILRGGLLCGTQTVYVGGTGAGKSMALIGSACASILHGHDTAFATLELAEEWIEARVLAHLTETPIDGLLSRDACEATWRALGAALGRLEGAPTFGKLCIKKFDPGTTPADLFTWVAALEAKLGRKIRTLVVDYADFMRAPRKGKRKRDEEDTTYAALGDVYQTMRLWAEESQRWMITASQTRRKAQKTGNGGKAQGMESLVDVDDVSDSMGKVRRADYVFTLNPSFDNTECGIFVAKSRHSEGRQRLAPLRTDFACARLVVPTYPTQVARELRRIVEGK